MSRLYPCAACAAWNRLPVQEASLARVVCGKCKRPLFSGQVLTIGDARTFDAVLQAPLPALVDFWAPWCAPCRVLAPVLEELAGELAGSMIVAKVNIDEAQVLAARFQIRAVPTMLVLSAGKVVDTISGAMPKAALRQRLEPWLRAQ